MSLPVIIRIFKSEQLIEVRQFSSDQSIVIGQSLNAQLRLVDTSISELHTLIEKRGENYYVSDLGSQTGTYKNSQQVLESMLVSGDELNIGPYRIVFFVGIPKPQEKKEEAFVSVPAPVPASVQESTPPAPELVQSAPDPVKEPKELPPAFEKPEIQGKIVQKELPNLVSAPASGGEAKSSPKTFAPASSYKDLSEIVQSGRGALVEVVVAWRERVLETHHFSGSKVVRVGRGNVDIQLPQQFASSNFVLMEVAGGTFIHIHANMSVTLYSEQQTLSLQDLESRGRVIRRGNAKALKLEQGESIRIGLDGDNINLFIRYKGGSPRATVMPFWDFSTAEITGILISLILVALIAIYVAISAPKKELEAEKEQEMMRIAQFIYEKPKPPPPPVEPEPVRTPPPVEPPKPVRVELSDKERVQKAAPQPNKEISDQRGKSGSAGTASDVRPKPTKVDRPKSFTSTKQGAAVKISEKDSAGAQSNKDVSKIGLFSAFGGGGARTQLDQAYSGSGEVLGMAEKATGTSGQSADRAGGDLGSKFKDTGAGGRGTQTQGIAGVATKGRGSGEVGYGSATSGIGGKGNVSIETGGVGEAFVGTIDREAVRRVVRAGLREVRSCYERELEKNPTIAGKLIVEWVITTGGSVKSAAVKSSELGNKVVEQCIVARLKTWRFPEPPSGTEAVVSYPFVFVRQK